MWSLLPTQNSQQASQDHYTHILSITMNQSLHVFAQYQINQHIIYHTYYHAPSLPFIIQLQWNYQIKSDRGIIRIQPYIPDGLGGCFAIDTQRSYVDILSLINNANKHCNTFKYSISQSNMIEIMGIFPSCQIQSQNKFRPIINSLKTTLNIQLPKIIKIYNIFNENYHTITQQNNIKNTSKIFIDQTNKLILMTKYNHIKNELENQYKIQGQSTPITHEEIENKLEYYRNQAIKKMKDCFKLLGIQDNILNINTRTIPMYPQWIHNKKIKKQIQQNHNKNVIKITILNELSQPKETNIQGGHGKLQLIKFKLLLNYSINLQINKHLQQILSKVDNEEQKNKKIIEIQLIKKIAKNQSKIEIINSFKNQCDFITYIKDRKCTYISTYYWDCQKKQQDNSVLMDYYPQNLLELLINQGKYMSLLQKLLIITNIIKGISWLADNYVCHRDIKPTNIMIGPNKIPKIIDFGSCCPVNGANKHFKVKSVRLLGSQKYFYKYSAQFQSRYTKKEYEQHLLFDAYSLGRVMQDVFRQGISNILPNLRQFLAYIIKRCKQPDPANRLTYQQLQYLCEIILQSLEKQKLE